MDKRVVIIVVVVLLLAAAGAAWYVYQSKIPVGTIADFSKPSGGGGGTVKPPIGGQKDLPANVKG